MLDQSKIIPTIDLLTDLAEHLDYKIQHEGYLTPEELKLAENEYFSINVTIAALLRQKDDQSFIHQS